MDDQTQGLQTATAGTFHIQLNCFRVEIGPKLCGSLLLLSLLASWFKVIGATHCK